MDITTRLWHRGLRQYGVQRSLGIAGVELIAYEFEEPPHKNIVRMRSVVHASLSRMMANYITLAEAVRHPDLYVLEQALSPHADREGTPIFINDIIKVDSAVGCTYEYTHQLPVWNPRTQAVELQVIAVGGGGTIKDCGKGERAADYIWALRPDDLLIINDVHRYEDGRLEGYANQKI
jgi:hypothetical protein